MSGTGSLKEGEQGLFISCILYKSLPVCNSWYYKQLVSLSFVFISFHSVFLLCFGSSFGYVAQ